MLWVIRFFRPRRILCMSSLQTPQHRDEQPGKIQPSDMEPGQLLKDLEQRQDDVLAQLDDLDAKLNEVLKGLGATMEGDADETEIGEVRDAGPDRGEITPMAA